MADIANFPFRNITITSSAQGQNDETKTSGSPKLGFSRAYSLSLSPQLIYTRSNVLPALVCSKVYRQLEFLAVGSWWLYVHDDNRDAKDEETKKAGENDFCGNLRKIPGGREDVFGDKNIDRRSMMPLMKFLKLAADTEAHSLILEEWGQKPFPDFLDGQFKISPQLQELLFTLTLSQSSPATTLTNYALPQIHRHLTSIGMFGAGFGSVLPKWGGLAEISQVACRACAVGGGVYVLKKGLQAGDALDGQASERRGIQVDSETQLLHLNLDGCESVRTNWVVGSQWDLPPRTQDQSVNESRCIHVSRSITIVSGLLQQLFPPPAEGAPSPAGAVAVFPIRMLRDNLDKQETQSFKSDPPPIYLAIHSSDTGECPTGQCRCNRILFPLFSTIHDDTKSRILIYIVCNFIEDNQSLAV